MTSQTEVAVETVELPQELISWFSSRLVDVVPALADRHTVTGDQNQKRIQIVVDLGDSVSEAKMLCGAGRSNLRMLLHFLRVQQVLPHNRYIELVLRVCGEDQVYLNKDVSTNRRQAKSPAELARLMQRNQLIVVRIPQDLES